MAQNKLVSKEYAKKLGFELKLNGVEHGNSEQDYGLPVNKFDEVEIPSWRHAIINLPHPLLKQGLVILDTPGLNAIGAEPELTVNQLSTAHTVVFVLAIDTGVSQSDLNLWREQLLKKDTQTTLIALNKIDSLWDGIRSDQEIEIEINKQIEQTAEILGISRDNIYPRAAFQNLKKPLAKGSFLPKSKLLVLPWKNSFRCLPTTPNQFIADAFVTSKNTLLNSI